MKKQMTSDNEEAWPHRLDATSNDEKVYYYHYYYHSYYHSSYYRYNITIIIVIIITIRIYLNGLGIILHIHLGKK